MNGAEFYETFKDALCFLGVGFTGMHLVKVTICDSQLVVSYNQRSAVIILEEK
jgi:hypothetical protein